MNTLSAKIKISFAIMVLLLLIGTIASSIGLWSFSVTIDAITKKASVRSTGARDLLTSYTLLGQHARNTAILSDLKQIDLEGNAFRSELERFLALQQEMKNSFSNLGAENEELAIQRDIDSRVSAAIEFLNKAMAAGTAGDSMAAVKILTVDMRITEESLMKSLSSFIAVQDRLTSQYIDDVEQLKRVLYGVLTIILASSILISVGAAVKLSKLIVGRIELAVAQSENIAAGDLRGSGVPTSSDEVGHLLSAVDAMRQQLMHLVAEIGKTVESIELAASEVSAGNQDLSDRTEKSAFHLEQANTWLGGLVEAVNENSLKSTQASQLAVHTTSITAQARDLVKTAIEKMADISQSSNKISTITTVIDGIAFQTNILALNAAVEAARAGEHGRGFSVVASEVRLLASRASDAAKEIRSLVETSVVNSRSGSVAISEAGTSMAEVLNSVGELSKFVEDIQTSGMHQTRELTEVASAISQIESATQQNAALVEETSAAARSLKDQSSKLLEQTKYFTVEGEVDSEISEPPQLALQAIGR